MFAVILHIWLWWLNPQTHAHERLSHLYSKSPTKCEAKAYQWSRKHSRWASPHYFLLRLDLDAYAKTEESRLKNRLLRNALTHAKNLEKSDIETFEAKATYDSLKTVLHILSNKEYNRLLIDGEQSRADLLKRKMKYIQLSVQSDKSAEKNQNQTVLDTLKIDEHSNSVQFFGLPNGSEYVPSTYPMKEKELLNIINEERRQNGLQDLVWDKQLARAARYHAFDMASQEYFSHETRDRSPEGVITIGGPFDRIRKFYRSGFANGENIAAGNSSAKGTYHQWLNSEGHHRNMLKRQSIKAGIGVAYLPGSPFGWYWVFCTASR